MAAAPSCSQVAAEAALNAITALLNETSATLSIIKVFSGSLPNSIEDADPSGLLSSGMTLSATAFGSATSSSSPYGATATANSVASDTDIATSGTAASFRAYHWSGSAWVPVIQGTCGTSAADMILNTTTLVAGATLECTSWVINLPSGGATG